MPEAPWLAGWSLAGHALAPFAPALLRRRLATGKEDPARWREKLGEPGLPRPDGRLVWLHAVGLGEVLALRGLVAAMAAEDPALSFLVTSTARSSAEAAGRNLGPRTRHQFLPLDLPGPRRRFLDHWRPDLSVWAEQDLWPGLVGDTARRGIPLALVNARMNAAAYRRRARARGLYGTLLRAFRIVAAQDAATARHLEALGARTPVAISGSLKPAAPPLTCDATELARLQVALEGRPVWLAGSCHPEDEAVAVAAHDLHRTARPYALLILAPRYPARGPTLAETTGAPLRSRGDQPTDHPLYIADTIGEMGLWYRLTPAALIGGSFGPVEGHNPWEAVRLGAAVLHGPRTVNFAADYTALDAAEAARPVAAPADIAAALADPALPAMADRAHALAEAQSAATRVLARELLALL